MTHIIDKNNIQLLLTSLSLSVGYKIYYPLKF